MLPQVGFQGRRQSFQILIPALPSLSAPGKPSPLFPHLLKKKKKAGLGHRRPLLDLQLDHSMAWDLLASRRKKDLSLLCGARVFFCPTAFSWLSLSHDWETHRLPWEMRACRASSQASIIFLSQAGLQPHRGFPRGHRWDPRGNYVMKKVQHGTSRCMHPGIERPPNPPCVAQINTQLTQHEA